MTTFCIVGFVACAVAGIWGVFQCAAVASAGQTPVNLRPYWLVLGILNAAVASASITMLVLAAAHLL